MENELIVQRETLTAVQVRAQVNLIQDVMKSIMKKDTHYGIIPGCQKPTLYKAGAEVLATTFRLAVTPEVFDLSTLDEIRYRVAVRLTSFNGSLVGTGIGEASTNEEKYMWRKAVCKEEFETTPEDRRRLKWARGKDVAYSTEQVRTNISDLANTVLKMAKKRAQIDAVLTATAASDIFTQDVEDLPDGILQEDRVQVSKPVTQPPTPAQKAHSGNNANVISENQGKRFYAIAKGRGMENEDMKEFLTFHLNIDSSRHIPADKYEGIILELQKWTK